MTSPVPPASFAPLADSNPVPGDAEQVARLGQRYKDTADEIQRQAANLRKLSSASEGAWIGQAGAKFREKAGDLADRIMKAHGRYAAAGAAVSGWVPDLVESQRDAYDAVREAQQAQQAMSANAPGPAPAPGSPPPTDDEKAAERRRAAAYLDAQDALRSATRRFHDAVDHYHSTAKAAASKIDAVSHHDSLHDSWWDRNFHWIKTALKILAIVIIVLAIAAIIIACPWTLSVLAFFGADAAVAAATLATVSSAITYITGGALLLSLAGHIAAASTGKGTWTDVALDAIGLATLGMGAAAERVIGSLAKSAEGIGASRVAASAARESLAGSDSLLARTVPATVYRLGQTELGGSILGNLPKVGAALADADTAATQATQALQATLATSRGSVPVALATESFNITHDLGNLTTLSHLGGIRIPILHAAGVGVAAVDGAVTSTVVGGSSGFTIYSLTQEQNAEQAFEHRLDQIVEQYSSPLSMTR